MSRRIVPLVTAVFAALALAGTASAASVQAQLADVRGLTAPYHRVSVALADGFVPMGGCEASPDGVMGIHYVNLARFDTTAAANTPEALLYAPLPNGRLRLIGVEYLQVDADQDLATSADRPTLFGRGFDGPMPGHVAGMPVHYDLHVWTWSHNPTGTFAIWNPALDC